MLHWLTLLALFGNALALGLYHDIDDYHLWRRGGPSVATTVDRECKKDILVIWDNSGSIGGKYFVEDVLPFLKNLIENPKLNVGEHGTQFGFITFSSEKKTYTLLEMGEKKSPDELTKWLKTLNYAKDLHGVYTYTGSAFKIAKETFDKHSPLNHRPGVDDVILLFTDGEPRANTKTRTAEQKQLADDSSKSLKDEKGVKIIGLAAGEPKKVAEFLPDIKKWSTEGSVFSAKLKELDDVVGQLVAETCGNAGECLCTKPITPFTVYAGPGQKSAKVSWPVPGAQTEKGNACEAVPGSVDPPGSEPGNQYPVKHHVITYKFSNGDAKKPKFTNCVIEFTVASCSCPASQTVKKQVPDGARTVSVSWNEPEPDCPTSPNPENPGTSESFSVGQYTRTYRYTYNLPGRDSFELTCHVTIMITGEMCGETAFDPAEKECCCGDVFVKKDRHECCGKKYINTDKEKCCNSKRANVVPAGGNCP